MKPQKPQNFEFPDEEILKEEKEKPESREDEENHNSEIELLSGVLRNDKIIVEKSQTAVELHEKNYFGEILQNGSFELSIIEALLLMERNRLEIQDLGGKIIRSDEILHRVVQKDPNIWIEYLVYRDLRQRGYIVRLGYGEEIHFRIFTRGANPKADIAKYFIFILEEDNAVRLDLLDKITKQSINSRKVLILATVDRLGDITYYQLEQFELPFNKNKKRNW